MRPMSSHEMSRRPVRPGSACAGADLAHLEVVRPNQAGFGALAMSRAQKGHTGGSGRFAESVSVFDG